MAISDAAETDEGPVSRRRMNPEARREQILATATQLIAASGFNSVSLADIANACGVTKPLILHYFPTMKRLLTDVLTRRDATDFLAIAGTEVPATFTRETARAFTSAMVKHNLKQRELIRLHHMLDAEALAPEHPAHAHFRHRAELSLSFAGKLLEWRNDPAIAAIQLMAFWHGLERQWLRDPDLDMWAIWDDFCELFFV